MKHLKTGLTGLWVGLALIGMPSHAHHSFGMFDMSAEAEIVVEGVVREWKFMNPHSWLLITVT